MFFLKKLFKFQEKTLGGFSMLFLIHARRKPLDGHLNPNVFLGELSRKGIWWSLNAFSPTSKKKTIGWPPDFFSIKF